MTYDNWQEAVAAEESRAIATENTIQANLTKEANRAMAKEVELDEALEELGRASGGSLSELNQRITDEAERAKQEETRLERRININKFGVNVTYLHDLQRPIVLEEAVELVPVPERRPGMKITFWTNGGWQTWQFYESLDVRYWPLPEYWRQEEGITDKLLDNAVTTQKIKDGNVTTDKLAGGAVTHEKLAGNAVKPNNLHPTVEAEVIQPMIDALGAQTGVKLAKLDEKYKNITKDLQNQIDSIQIGGWAVSNEFGGNTHIGISQKTLTDAFNRLWSKMEDITGEAYQGISMVITPEYYIGENGCTVHITANTVETNGIFEKISFYLNGTLLTEAENVDYFEYDTEITETTVVKCVAKIMGIDYEQQKIVTHYNSFWLGAGSSYQDIMDVSHVIPIQHGMKGAYDIDVAQGNRIFVIVGDSLAEGFRRADMEGVEIPFTESTVTVSGNVYKVFASVNTYNAGVYNIDINS